MTAKVLIVEDQEDIGSLIAVNLESLNLQTVHCRDGLQGYLEAQKNQYDAIILDIMLPGMEGLEVCQRLRQEANYTPILMLTAKKSEADRVVGLEVGADDYLTKPFSVRELQARIKALLRRVAFHENTHTNNQTEDLLRFDNLTIDIQKRKILRNDISINVTAKEFDLLLYMARHPGTVYTREQLLNAVWGYQHDGYEHTVNSHINRLRSKLEEDSTKPKFVLTVWGVGYKFYDS